MIYPVDPGRPENIDCLPAVGTVGAAKDDRFGKAPDPPGTHFDPVDRYVQGPGNMPLIIFIRGPEIDDHPAFL